MKVVLNLDPQFEPIINLPNITLDKKWKFNAGEVGIKLSDAYISPTTSVETVVITHRLNSSDAIMEILLVVNAIKKIKSDMKFELFIPYIPYARQDRVMEYGEPCSIQVFADLLKLCNFVRTYVMTPHSDVSLALINNVYDYSDINFIKSAIYFDKQGEIANGKSFSKDYVLCSPDAGAMKRTIKTAYYLQYKNRIAIGSKIRDTSDGSILRSDVDIQDFEGKDVYIVDDICSGGKTFLELGKVIKERNCGKIYLVVTHYENHPNAMQMKGVIDKVFCTDSLTTVVNNDLVQQLKIKVTI